MWATSSLIGWHESGVFSSAFYGAPFRNRGRGAKLADQAEDAATRAIDAYALLTDKNCPFKVTILKPSQRARTLLS